MFHAIWLENIQLFYIFWGDLTTHAWTEILPGGYSAGNKSSLSELVYCVNITFAMMCCAGFFYKTLHHLGLSAMFSISLSKITFEKETRLKIKENWIWRKNSTDGFEKWKGHWVYEVLKEVLWKWLRYLCSKMVEYFPDTLGVLKHWHYYSSFFFSFFKLSQYHLQNAYFYFYRIQM